MKFEQITFLQAQKFWTKPEIWRTSAYEFPQPKLEAFQIEHRSRRMVNLTRQVTDSLLQPSKGSCLGSEIHHQKRAPLARFSSSFLQAKPNSQAHSSTLWRLTLNFTSSWQTPNPPKGSCLGSEIHHKKKPPMAGFSSSFVQAKQNALNKFLNSMTLDVTFHAIMTNDDHSLTLTQSILPLLRD